MDQANQVDPTIAFRLATLDDVGAIVDLVESAYRGERSKVGWTTEADLLAGQRTDTAGVTATISRPESRLLLASDAATGLLGCCQLERRSGGVAYFGTFAVRPGLQGGGLGKRLLAEAERQARDDWGATTMQMTVIAQRTELIAWYVRRGYHPTGETQPFPYGDERFGQPLRPDLHFTVLAKDLT
jgi:GNAT superfamily N-acetyltransferase